MEIILLSLYATVLIIVIAKIFRYVKDPDRAFAWILAVIFIPAIGILFYFLVGKHSDNHRIFSEKSPFHDVKNAVVKEELLPPSKLSLIKLLQHNKSSAISYGNRVTILKDGEETFEHIFSAMREATSSIHLDFYIMEAGKILEECIEICEDRIKQGVSIRLIYDGFGTFNLSSSYIKRLKKIGVECYEFFPFSLWNLSRFVKYRNHRKIVIVDNRVAFTGGMNISDKYMKSNNRLGLWRDTFIKVEGPAAKDFERVFKSDWHYSKGRPYDLLPLTPTEYPDGCPVQVVASGPDSEHQGIMHEYFSVLVGANDYVYLVIPYFVPGEALITAFKTAAMSGTDIQIMIPYDSDSKWMKWCMFTYLEELLQAGVRVFLFLDGFLHAKVIISDNVVSSIGTANIDDRSFKQNFEVNALVYDKVTALRLKKQFVEDKNKCEEITLETFPNRKDRNKVMESLARLTSSAL